MNSRSVSETLCALLGLTNVQLFLCVKRASTKAAATLIMCTLNISKLVVDVHPCMFTQCVLI